jgi:hypothetical protein
MANKKSNIEIILSARDVNLSSVIGKGRAAVKAFTSEVGGSGGQVAAMRAQVLQLAGAFAGLSAIGDVGAMLKQADQNAYGLSASIQAANREFAVGSAADWEQTITDLSAKLKIYSQSEVRGAAAATIDMTKRLGLNAEQMQQVIALSGDLAAGRTDLAGAVERVTAALRGEAEASEYLGLTLNETYVTAWYNARGATQGAWKDLTDLQKAQVRYNVFLEQAIPLQGKAAESINTWSGSLAYVRTTVADSIGNNQELVKALAEVGVALRDNAGGIGQFAANIATGAAAAIRFAAANHEVIVEVLKYGAAFTVAFNVIAKLTATWRGLNAVMLVVTGSRIIPWLQSLEAGTNLAAAGVSTLKVGMVGLMGATAAFFAAYRAGEWLTMRSAIAGTAEAQKQLEKSSGLVAAKFKEISQATGLTITSMEQLDAAVKAGEIHYDELTGTWKKGAKEQQAATRQTADVSKQVTGAALEAMKKQYQDYASKVRDLQDQIAGHQKSVAAQLREMSRSGMSDVSAWKDQKKEAEEYMAAAKQAAAAAQSAFSSGDTLTGEAKFKEARQYADDARAAYANLNTEVKDGERVVITSQQALKTSFDGVKQAGSLGFEILTKQEAAAKSFMGELKNKSGFADLTEGMSEAEKKWLENWQTMSTYTLDKIKEIDLKLDEVANKKRTAKLVIDYEDGSRSVSTSSYSKGGRIGAYRNGGMIQQIQALASGGGVRNILSGGRLPGFGGGDRRLLLGEDGEVMLRKESVKAGGLRAALAFNAGRFDVVLAELSKRMGTNIGYRLGGLIDSLPQIPQRLASGGSVAAMATATPYSASFTFQDQSGQVGRVYGHEIDIKRLESAVAKHNRYRSSNR